jgi:uncharacterized membrane protein
MDHAMAAKLHGATVHFPIALVLCSGALDALGCCWPDAPARRGLHAAGYWTMMFGAAGSVPVVVSGLVMTQGVLLGHDALRLHHLFAWPAFALTLGIATWRAGAKDFATQKTAARYLAVVGLAAVLVMMAGYWGGEMLLTS